MSDRQKLTDQMGRKVEIPKNPKRIISLVPSQTELHFDLGLDEEVSGVTKFCIHPGHWRKSKAIVGGTKKFRFDVIDEVKPDLILGNKEENYKEGIAILEAKYSIWMSDINKLTDAFEMMRSIGTLVNKALEAEYMVQTINSSLNTLSKKNRGSALYLIWRDPYMCAGRSTFINEMMTYAGFENVLPEKSRYPEVSIQEIIHLQPETVLLSSEPYPFNKKHQLELSSLLPDTKIRLIDGEIFSWYGSRLLKAPNYLRKF